MSNYSQENEPVVTAKDDAETSVERLLFDVITQIHRLYNLTTAGFNRGQSNELHVSHFSVLNHLVLAGDAKPPQQLAASMNLTKATMTSNLGRLADRGFITVQNNPNDKRSKLVFLTPDGRKERDAAIERARGGLQAYLTHLTPSEVQEASLLLDRLYQAMSAAEAEQH
ncbi:MAG: MarR family winged helix-turn-helix transcriptional regulator [Pseudomonadota bacterium]